VKRFIAAISLAVFAGAGFAADPPFGRTSLPQLAGSTGAAKMWGDLQRRQLERRQYRGPRSYWENDPLFIAPPP
jgi:hypothetical protein